MNLLYKQGTAPGSEIASNPMINELNNKYCRIAFKGTAIFAAILFAAPGKAQPAENDSLNSNILDEVIISGKLIPAKKIFFRYIDEHFQSRLPDTVLTYTFNFITYKDSANSRETIDSIAGNFYTSRIAAISTKLTWN